MVRPNASDDRGVATTTNMSETSAEPRAKDAGHGRLAEAFGSGERAREEARTATVAPGDGARAVLTTEKDERVVVEVRRPQQKKRHWLRNTLIVVAALILLLIIAVEVVFHTDLPRSILLKALEKSLGVKAEAASVSTGWWG